MSADRCCAGPKLTSGDFCSFKESVLLVWVWKEEKDLEKDLGKGFSERESFGVPRYELSGRKRN